MSEQSNPGPRPEAGTPSAGSRPAGGTSEGVELGGVQTTRLNKSWVVKTCIYLVVLLGLGVWGLYDGLIVYPNRGRGAASFLEKEYLIQAEEAGSLLRASVQDPETEYERLQAAETELRSRVATAMAENRSADQAEMELARLEWLTALSRIGWLNEQHTVITDASGRLTTLQQEWASRKPPKPLSAFDIPSQWLIAIAGLGLGGWILLLFALVARKKYKYEPRIMRLTLPCGASMTPSDIAEVDKRLWHKFFVTLRTKDGKAYKLDLLRYTPLEQWVLEMEKHTDGYEPPRDETAEPTATDAPAGVPSPM